jgi:hypothetical protein
MRVDSFTIQAPWHPLTMSLPLLASISDADDLCNLFTGVFGDDLLTGSDKDTIVETAKRSLQNERLF